MIASHTNHSQVKGSSPVLSITVKSSPVDVYGDKYDKSRRSRYELRGGLRGVSTIQRCKNCGTAPIDRNRPVSIHKSDAGKGYFSNVQVCGRVWICPVCSAKVRQGYAEQIDAVVKPHVAAGGGVYMQLLTIPHKASDTLDESILLISHLWKRIFSGGARWKRFRDCHGIQYVRALEFTHGKNGWHAHYHVLWFTDKVLDAEELAGFEDYSYERWRAELVKLGCRPPKRKVFGISQVDTCEALSKYITKAVLESVRLDVKKGTQESRTPFEILRDAVAGCKRSVMLWREYEVATHRKRAVQPSQGLYKRYAVKEQTDEELAAAEVGGASVYTVPAGGFEFIKDTGVLCDVLLAVAILNNEFLQAALDLLFGPVCEHYLTTGDETHVSEWLEDVLAAYHSPP